MWNETFRFVLPAQKPGEAAPMLRVSVMNSNRLLPDRRGGRSAHSGIPFELAGLRPAMLGGLACLLGSDSFRV